MPSSFALVTGASGNLGRAVVSRLEADGFRVRARRALANRAGRGRGRSVRPRRRSEHAPRVRHACSRAAGFTQSCIRSARSSRAAASPTCRTPSFWSLESTAAEIEGSGVTLIAVLPSTMDTPQNRAAMPKVDPARWVTLDEVANVLRFLVSDEAPGVHGQSVRVERS